MDWLLLFLGSCISYLSLQRECSMVLPRLGYSPRNARRPNPAPREIFFIQNTPLRDCMEGGRGGGIWGTGCLNYFIHRCSSIRMIIRTHRTYKKNPWMFLIPCSAYNHIKQHGLLVCTCFHNQRFCWGFFFFYLIFFFLPVLWTTNSGIV